MSANLLRDALPPKRTGVAPDEELLGRRAMIAELSGPEDADHYANYGGIDCAVAASAAPRAIIIHCHGGGYRHGTARGWAAFAVRLAAATDTRVIVPDYVLAPEHPFPAGLHDIAAVVADVVAQKPGLPILLTGDSAGGGLALAIASALARPLPLAGIVLLSPWLDLRLVSGSYERCATSDPIFSHASASISADAYLQGVGADHVLASPLLADLSGLPPVQVHVGGGEVLFDDSLALVERLAHAGVQADLAVETDAPHVWPVAFPAMPATQRTLVRFRQFVDEVVAKA